MNPDVSRNPQESQGKLNFKCSDVGPKNCDWQVSGNSEQEIMTTKRVARCATQFGGKRRKTAAPHSWKCVALSLGGRPWPPFPYRQAAPSYPSSKRPFACFLWNNARNWGLNVGIYGRDFRSPFELDVPDRRHRLHLRYPGRGL